MPSAAPAGLAGRCYPLSHERESHDMVLSRFEAGGSWVFPWACDRKRQRRVLSLSLIVAQVFDLSRGLSKKIFCRTMRTLPVLGFIGRVRAYRRHVYST